MSATSILCAVTALAIGGAAGSALTYRLTATVTCQAPVSAPAQSGIPPSFFQSQPHPTTGGQQY